MNRSWRVGILRPPFVLPPESPFCVPFYRCWLPLAFLYTQTAAAEKPNNFTLLGRCLLECNDSSVRHKNAGVANRSELNHGSTSSWLGKEQPLIVCSLICETGIISLTSQDY